MSSINLNISDDILVDAHRMRHNNLQKRMLVEYITDILKRIKDEINIARQEGNRFITTDIPTVFTIPDIDNSDCQRIIWSTVMEKLIKRHYRIKWDFKSQRCTLYITWISQEDESIVNRQLNILTRLKTKI